MATEEEPAAEMLTFAELARIHRFPDDYLDTELIDKLVEHVLADPRYAGMMEQAEELARDAGVDCPGIAFWHYEDLEKLLAAEGWDDPAEVLQPGDEDTSLLGHRRLIRMIDARLARGEGDAGRLLEVRERVERHEVKYTERALQELLPWFARLSPGSAARFRERALVELRATQEPAAAPPEESEAAR